MRSAVKAALGCLFLFAFTWCAADTGDAALPYPIKASHFGAGIFRGVTVADLRPDGTEVYKESDFADLSRTGANLVRVFLHLRKCATCDLYDFPEAEVRYVERLLTRGELYGFRVVVSLLPLPGFAKAEYWNSLKLKQDISYNWEKIAIRLKSHHHQRALAAYDLINEPVPPSILPPFMQRSLWREFAIALTKSIRKVDPDRTVIFEPVPWAFPSAFRDLEMLPFDNVVYSVHVYQPREFTHQGLYELPFGPSYPSSKWDKSWLAETLAPVREFARRTGASIFVGEFSAVRWAPDNSATRYIDDAIDLFEEESWSWAYLGWRGYQGWDAEIPPDVPKVQKQGRLPEARRHDAPIISVLRSGYARNPRAR